MSGKGATSYKVDFFAPDYFDKEYLDFLEEEASYENLFVDYKFSSNSSIVTGKVKGGSDCLIQFNDNDDIERMTKQLEKVHPNFFQDYSLIFRVSFRKNGAGPYFFQIKPSSIGEVSGSYVSARAVFAECYRRIEVYNYLQNDRFLRVGSIHFKPEQKQAGLQILSYFQETLTQKFPASDVTVSFSQNGNIVSMQIETSDGRTEVYEKAFEEYKLVVTGRKPVEEYLEDRINQAQLITKLELAGAELRSTERLLGIEREKNQILQDNLAFAQKMLESTIGGNLQLANKLGDAHIRALGNQDISKLLLHLDSILSSKGENFAAEELKELKSKDSTIWSALVKHAYNIAEKAVYKAGSEQLIALIITIAEQA